MVFGVGVPAGVAKVGMRVLLAPEEPLDAHFDFAEDIHCESWSSARCGWVGARLRLLPEWGQWKLWLTFIASQRKSPDGLGEEDWELKKEMRGSAILSE